MKVEAATPSPPGKPRVEVVPAEARGIQGHPAGLISRTIANILDLGLVFAFVAGTYVAWAGVKLLWQGREFTRPTREDRTRVRVLGGGARVVALRGVVDRLHSPVRPTG